LIRRCAPWQGPKKNAFGQIIPEGANLLHSATLLSWPFGFRPVALRHRLSTALPFRAPMYFDDTGLLRSNSLLSKEADTKNSCRKSDGFVKYHE
jgi:hypothetical protein